MVITVAVQLCGTIVCSLFHTNLIVKTKAKAKCMAVSKEWYIDDIFFMFSTLGQT